VTDLRKAAEMALESWGFFFSQAHPEIVGLMYGNDWAKIAKERTEALRQALLQPKREWVGLTEEEVESWRGNFDFFDSALVREVEAKLKEKNT
jgi:hypothetical protein